MINNQVDLNLLPIFLVLMRERSVTRTARFLGVSQPTVSRALATLREQLGDELLIRTRKGMEPTQRAEALVEPLTRALDEVQRALDVPTTFDPASSCVTFTLSIGDYESLVLLPTLYARFTTLAPQARLSVQYHRRPSVEEALNNGAVHLAIGRFVNAGTHFNQMKLFSDSFVVAMCRGHRLDKNPLSLKEFASAPHILISPGGTGDFRGLIDDELDAAKSPRIVTLSLPHFLAAPHILTTTNSVMAIPRRLIEPYLKSLEISIQPLPLRNKGFDISMMWHHRTHNDPACNWLRNQIMKIASEINIK